VTHAKLAKHRSTCNEQPHPNRGPLGDVKGFPSRIRRKRQCGTEPKWEKAGAEVFLLAGDNRAERMGSLLDELGKRQMTNLLVEGGSEVFGTLFDLGAIDEVHAFVAAKLIGGKSAPGPIAGLGLAEMSAAMELEPLQIEQLGNDLYVHGFVG